MSRQYDTLVIAMVISLAAAISCPAAALETISENKIRAHTQFLSDDMLGGRGVGSPGEELAIRYIAAQFQTLVSALSASALGRKRGLVRSATPVVPVPAFASGSPK